MGKFLLSTLLLLTTAFASTAANWKLLTSDMSLNDGDIIALTAKSYTGTYSKQSVTIKPMIATTYGKNILKCSEFNEDINIEAAYEIRLKKSGESWILMHETYYLQAEDKKITETETDPNQTFSIKIEEAGNIVIALPADAITKNKTHSLQYNPNLQSTNAEDGAQNARFAFYGSNQQKVYAYVKVLSNPEALSKPEIHEDCQNMLTEGAITKEGNLKFADVAEGIDLWYKLEQNQSANALAEVDATHEHGTEGYTKYDPATGIDITKNYVGHILTVFACDASNDIHSEPVSYAVTVSTGVAEIEAAGAGEVRWFDMQGREVKGQPEKGIYVRVANGKASKVIL